MAAIQLIDGIEKLGLIPDMARVDQLNKYVELLLKWNTVYSLTAITDINQIITRHLLDGLTIIPYIQPCGRVIDVGSGMGVPGVIVAIWNPNCMVTVLDTNNKKTAFLQQVAIELKLNNLHVVTSRVETYLPEIKFDMVISRAFAAINLFINLTKHLLKPNGMFIAMKSRAVIDELNQLPKNYKYDCVDVEIPGIIDKRVLVIIQITEKN